MKHPKNQTIIFRCSENEKKEIIQKASCEGFTTVTAFLKAASKRYVSLRINMDEYYRLLNETRKIGRNVNSIVRDIRFSNFFTDKDLLDIKTSLTNIEELMKQKRKQLREYEDTFYRLEDKELEKILAQEKLEKPLELIYNQLIEMIKNNLLDIIDLMQDKSFASHHKELIYLFIYSLLPDVYSLPEMQKINDAVYTYVRKIKNKLTNPKNSFMMDDFRELISLIESHEKFEQHA